MSEKPSKITKTFVEGLPLPESGQTFVWDTELKGFGVRLTPGGRTYIVQGRVNGKNRRVSLGKHGVITAEEARRKARKNLVKLSDGIDPAIEKARDKHLAVTLATAAADYIKDRRDRPDRRGLKQSSINDINKHLNKSFSDWKDKPVSSLTRDKVADRHEELTKKSPAQADQAFRVLRALLNYSIARYRPDDTPIILENPVNILNQRRCWNKVKPREIRVPDGRLGNAWNLLTALRTDPAQTKISRTNADLITFILLTGTRWNEAAGLTWDRLNLKEGWFHLPDPKNRNPVTLPLSTDLQKILSDRPRNSDYVFPARSGIGCTKDARGTLQKLAAVIGIEKISAHDLRRTFINTALKQCKIDLWKTKMLTNHKFSEDVTIDVYSDKQDLRFLAQETEQITSWIIEQGRIAANAEQGAGHE